MRFILAGPFFRTRTNSNASGLASQVNSESVIYRNMPRHTEEYGAGGYLTRLIILPVLMVLQSCVCFPEQCNASKLDNEQIVLEVLSKLDPNDRDSDSRKCIQTAIEIASQLRSGIAIPQLIRYLAFRRDKYPDEGTGMLLHMPIEGDEYPAIVALARIGAGARPALLQAIESDVSSVTEKQNAAHAIGLSFMYEPDRNPGNGIAFLRDAERTADDRKKINLEQAVAFILTTRACQRYADKCDEANRRSGGK